MFQIYCILQLICSICDKGESIFAYTVMYLEMYMNRPTCVQSSQLSSNSVSSTYTKHEHPNSHIIRAWYFITHITWKCMYIYIVFLYSNTVVSGMREVPCKTIDEVLYCLQHGSAARQTGSTQMNEHSSRSHSVFTVNLGQYYE